MARTAVRAVVPELMPVARDKIHVPGEALTELGVVARLESVPACVMNRKATVQTLMKFAQPGDEVLDRVTQKNGEIASRVA